MGATEPTSEGSSQQTLLGLPSNQGTKRKLASDVLAMTQDEDRTPFGRKRRGGGMEVMVRLSGERKRGNCIMYVLVRTRCTSSD